MRSSRSRGASAALFVAAALACASVAPEHPELLVLSVSNELGRTVAEIWRKDCDAADSKLALIDGSKLRAGEVRRIVLPPTCVDLVAFDERGRQVGQQRELVMLPGARWVLRR